MLGVSLRSTIKTVYFCGCHDRGASSTHEITREMSIQVPLPPTKVSVTLSDLLPVSGAIGAPEDIEVERPACTVCGAPPENTKTLRVDTAGDVLVLVVLREAVAQRVARGEDSRNFAGSKNRQKVGHYETDNRADQLTLEEKSAGRVPY